MRQTDLIDTVRARMIAEHGPAVPSSGTERRRHLRLPTFDLQGTVFDGSGEYPVAVRDLSVSGAGLVCREAGIKVGSTIVLGTRLGDQGTFVVEGKVIHAKPLGNEWSIGMRFGDMKREDVKQLLAYLHYLLHKSEDDESRRARFTR
jgi:hypothetical protein